MEIAHAEQAERYRVGIFISGVNLPELLVPPFGADLMKPNQVCVLSSVRTGNICEQRRFISARAIVLASESSSPPELANSHLAIDPAVRRTCSSEAVNLLILAKFDTGGPGIKWMYHIS